MAIQRYQFPLQLYGKGLGISVAIPLNGALTIYWFIAFSCGFGDLGLQHRYYTVVITS
jgi:hypothetical protein